MNRWLLFSLLLTAAALAAVLLVYCTAFEHLRPEIAVHWDLHFEPDQTVPRANALPRLLLYPGVMAGIILLALVLPWLSPRQFQVDRFRPVWDYLMGLLVALFGYLLFVQLLCSLEDGPEPGRLFVGGIFLFFALVGNVLGKVQRNFWLGVRTPWTLASEAVWIRTHRLTAWLWTGFGVLGFVAVLAGVPFAWCFGGLIVAALIPVVYSLVLYQKLEKQGKV